MEDLGEEDVADEAIVCRDLEGHLHLQSTTSLAIVDLEYLFALSIT